MAKNSPNNILPFRQREQNQDSKTSAENQRAYSSNVENINQYALAEDRAARKDDSEIARIQGEIHPPNSTRYIIAFTYAVFLDILDFFEDAADVTGVGIIATIALDFVLDLPFVWLGFTSGKELRKIGMAEMGITEKISMIRQKATQYRNLYATTLRASRRINVLRKPVRQIASKFKSARRIITKSPVGRYIFASLVDMIPLIDLLPFRTWGVWSSYRQEKKAYQEFQLLISEDYPEARAEEVAAVADYEDLQMEEEAEAMEELAA